MTQPEPHRWTLLQIVRGPGEVYGVELPVPEDFDAGLSWMLQPGARQLARPYLQALIGYAEEKIDRALSDGSVL